MAFTQPSTLAPLNYQATPDAALFQMYRNWWQLNEERIALIDALKTSPASEVQMREGDLIALHRQIESLESMISNTQPRTIAGLTAKHQSESILCGRHNARRARRRI